MSLTATLSLLSPQAIVLRTRTCDSKRNVCTASVDSIMDIRAYAFSQHNKGNLLYSIATAQSKMVYSPKVVDDGVVDNPPSYGLSLTMNSPSLLWSKANLKSSEFFERALCTMSSAGISGSCLGIDSNRQDSNGAQHNLCLGLSPTPHRKSLMVQLSYHLPSVCTEMLSFSYDL